MITSSSFILCSVVFDSTSTLSSLGEEGKGSEGLVILGEEDRRGDRENMRREGIEEVGEELRGEKDGGEGKERKDIGE